MEPGLCADVELTVGEEDTAVALRSGDVLVLGTPRIVALCEEAAMAATRDHLPAGQTTVGHTVQLDHVAPTRVGGIVRAEATLQKVSGRRLTFTVSVTDGRGLVAAGIVSRVVVEIERFMETAQ